MAENQGLLSGGWDRVARNKRYIVWFYLLNLVLAWLGTAAFSNQAARLFSITVCCRTAWCTALTSACWSRCLRGPSLVRLTLPEPAGVALCLALLCRDRAFLARSAARLCLDLPVAARGFFPRLRTEPVAIYPADDCGGHRDGNRGRSAVRPSRRSGEEGRGEHERIAAGLSIVSLVWS